MQTVRSGLDLDLELEPGTKFVDKLSWWRHDGILRILLTSTVSTRTKFQHDHGQWTLIFCLTPLILSASNTRSRSTLFSANVHTREAIWKLTKVCKPTNFSCQDGWEMCSQVQMPEQLCFCQSAWLFFSSPETLKCSCKRTHFFLCQNGRVINYVLSCTNARTV